MQQNDLDRLKESVLEAIFILTSQTPEDRYFRPGEIADALAEEFPVGRNTLIGYLHKTLGYYVSTGHVLRMKGARQVSYKADMTRFGKEGPLD